MVLANLNLFQKLFGTSTSSVVVTFILLIFIIVFILPIVLRVINPVYEFILRFINLVILKNNKLVFYKLIPPHDLAETNSAVSELLEAIHHLNQTKKLVDRIVYKIRPVSLEIVSSKYDGIYYLFCIPQDYAKSLSDLAKNYLKNFRVEKVKDYLDKFSVGKALVYDVILSKNKYRKSLGSSANLDLLISSMGKLKTDELIVYQLVAYPIHNRVSLINQRNVIARIFYIIRYIYIFIFRFIVLIFELVLSLFLINSVSLLKNRNRIYSPVNKELYFRVGIKQLVLINNEQDQKKYINQLKSSFRLLGVNLARKVRYIRSRNIGFRLNDFRLRCPRLLRYTDLSIYELESLFNFNYAVNKSDNSIEKNLTKTLSVTTSARKKIIEKKIDLFLGRSNHQDDKTLIGLTLEERMRHVFILGGTGNGKSTMLFYAINQDISAGNGLCVIDPNGDLAEKILENIPEKRIKDVIYFNPDDTTYPININLLEIDKNLDPEELEKRKEQVTESIISVFRKLFSKDNSGGHRIEYVLRNTIQTALTLESPTLFTLFDLLDDDRYRNKVIRDLKDQKLKNFWMNEFGRAGGMQKVKLAFGVTSKLGRFSFSLPMKRVMGNYKSTINFDQIVNQKKILICNLSKGRIGEDNSMLFGSSILALLQMAINRRENIDEKDRIPFYLYVDEFQNFADISFIQMLSEARKYRLYLVIAEQSLSQQEDKRLNNVILANCGTIVCFRTGSPEDTKAIQPFFSPSIKKSDINNLESFNFFIKILAIKPELPMSGETIVSMGDTYKENKSLVIKSSRKLYGRKYVETKKNDDDKKNYNELRSVDV